MCGIFFSGGGQPDSILVLHAEIGKMPSDILNNGQKVSCDYWQVFCLKHSSVVHACTACLAGQVLSCDFCLSDCKLFAPVLAADIHTLNPIWIFLHTVLSPFSSQLYPSHFYFFFCHRRVQYKCACHSPFLICLDVTDSLYLSVSVSFFLSTAKPAVVLPLMWYLMASELLVRWLVCNIPFAPQNSSQVSWWLPGSGTNLENANLVQKLRTLRMLVLIMGEMLGYNFSERGGKICPWESIASEM